MRCAAIQDQAPPYRVAPVRGRRHMPVSLRPPTKGRKGNTSAHRRGGAAGKSSKLFRWSSLSIPRWLACFGDFRAWSGCVNARAGILRHALFVAIVAVCGLVPVACGSSASTNVTSPSAGGRCEASVGAPTSSFGPTGGTGSVAVTVARECTWHAASQAGWITMTSAADGQGNGTVSFRVAENGDPVARQGALAVADRQVAVAQEPAPCRFEVASAATGIGPEGGELTVEVRGHPACTWTARSDVTWAAVSPNTGKGNAVVHVAVSRNPGTARQLSLVVAGQAVNAMQRSADSPPAPTPAPTPAPPGPAPAPTPAPSPSPTPSPAPEPAPTPPAPAPVPVRRIELSGRISDVSGTCPAIQFDLGERTVYTTDDTEFKKTACQKIDRGTELKVEGMEMSNGSVRADRVTKE